MTSPLPARYNSASAPALPVSYAAAAASRPRGVIADFAAYRQERRDAADLDRLTRDLQHAQARTVLTAASAHATAAALMAIDQAFYAQARVASQADPGFAPQAADWVQAVHQLSLDAFTNSYRGEHYEGRRR